MILVIADSSDWPALWLAERLRPRVPVPVTVVTPARLVYARSIVHRMDSAGGGFSFAFPDDERITDGEVQGVVNRFATLPTTHYQRAAPAERAYLAGELSAFLLGWLETLDCPVLNPPAPGMLAGEAPDPILIRHYAAAAGLFCDPVRLDAGRPAVPPCPAGPIAVHFVLDGRLIGPPLPPQERDAMIHFASMWRTRLVQIESDAKNGRRRLLAATSFADYSRGGAALVRAIASALVP